MPRCLLVFEPPDGGVPECVREIALGLHRHGWEPWVAGPSESIAYPDLERAGVPVARLPFERGYRRPGRELAALRRLTATMRRRRFDLVHLHSAKAGALGRVAAAATGTPAVYSPHCFPFVGSWSARRVHLSALAERALARVTRAIICVAEDERGQALARRVGGPQRLRVVHNGVAGCRPLPPDPQLAEWAQDGPVAGAIAVLRPQKGIATLLAAAPRVLDSVPDARLAIVGDGPLRAELVDRARAAGLGDRIAFFPFEAPSARQLQSLDVFVLPSLWEALPLSILEAMACGVPQVATRVGGTAEAVEDGVTGLLCPPADPEALAGALIALLRDPRRRASMAAASRERHEARFTVERMVAETAQVYDGVSRSASPGS